MWYNGPQIWQAPQISFWKGRLSIWRNSRKSYEHVLTYLEDALRDGRLSLGQSLPPERDLAEQLGISRNSVREAIRLLEHMGFLVSSQGAGNFISCNIQRNLKDSFDMLILLQQIDYHQLAELRAGLELQAALLAADRITNTQVDRLDSLVRQMVACPPSWGPSWTSSSTMRLPPSRAISSSFRSSGPCPPPSTGSSATCAGKSCRIPAQAASSSMPTSRWWTPCAGGTRPI